MTRVTDEMVRRWLIWARNYEEIVSYREVAPRGRRWKIVVPDGIRVNAMGGGLFFNAPEDHVPTEMVLTSREALVFAMGCAVAGEKRSRHDWTQEDWEARSARKREGQREAPSQPSALPVASTEEGRHG